MNRLKPKGLAAVNAEHCRLYGTRDKFLSAAGIFRALPLWRFLICSAAVFFLLSSSPSAAQSLFAPGGGDPPASVQSPVPENVPHPARAAVPVGQVQTRGDSGSAQILVDEKGNKTLVVRGDSGASEVMVNSGGQQTQVIFGDDTAGLIMNDDGHKTLVIRGDVVDSSSRKTASGSKSKESGDNYEKPYWIVDEPVEERPYFLAEPQKEDVPYWQVKAEAEKAPYWQVEEEKYTRPYWLGEVEYREIIASEVQPGLPEPVDTAMAAPPGSSSPLGGGSNKVISYYMYQDDQGVKHLTNIPDDPRYRRFTAVVQVQVGRGGMGMGGRGLGRLRFTHESLRPIIMKAATAYNLDPALIAAVIRSESAFDARAVSWAGAQGLMQLMPSTAKDMGVTNSFDPEQNVMGGSRYLRLMLNEFGGDLSLALAAYNAGPNRVKRNWKIPNIPETQNYVVIVMRNYDRYRSQF